MSETLLRQMPAASHGTAIGVGDWRVAVEFSLPAGDAALWGVGLWGEALWSEVAWTDLTPRCRGVEWVRGAQEPGGRPGIGSGLITLVNDDGVLAPWMSEYHGPGTLLRVVAFSPSLGWWVPQIAGVVDRWRQYYAGARRNGFGDTYVEVSFSETPGLLVQIDDNALPGVVGSGETSGARGVRLLDAAGWRHGCYDEAAAGFTLQSTDMAANRWTELLQTADSTDVNFRAHRSGIAMLEQVDPALHPSYAPPTAARWGTAIWGTSEWSSPSIDWATARAGSVFYRRFELRPDRAGEVLPDENGRMICQLVYDPESLTPERHPDIIVNDVRLASIGGTQQAAADAVSQGRYGKRSLVRNDLRTQYQADVLTIAERIVARRANRSQQISAVDLTPRHGGVNVEGTNLPGMFVIDLADPVTFVMPDYQGRSGHVTAMLHRVTPMSAARVNWRCALSLELTDEFVPPSLVGSGGG